MIEYKDNKEAENLKYDLFLLLEHHINPLDGRKKYLKNELKWLKGFIPE